MNAEFSRAHRTPFAGQSTRVSAGSVGTPGRFHARARLRAPRHSGREPDRASPWQRHPRHAISEWRSPSSAALGGGPGGEGPALPGRRPLAAAPGVRCAAGCRARRCPARARQTRVGRGRRTRHAARAADPGSGYGAAHKELADVEPHGAVAFGSEQPPALPGHRRHHLLHLALHADGAYLCGAGHLPRRHSPRTRGPNRAMCTRRPAAGNAGDPRTSRMRVWVGEKGKRVLGTPSSLITAG